MGGGAVVEESAALLATRSVFGRAGSGNIAKYGGGLVFSNIMVAFCVNCTVSGNVATAMGGEKHIFSTLISMGVITQ
jgi:hypothetical protein